MVAAIHPTLEELHEYTVQRRNRKKLVKAGLAMVEYAFVERADLKTILITTTDQYAGWFVCTKSCKDNTAMYAMITFTRDDALCQFRRRLQLQEANYEQTY